jgi:hypothetical protein
MKKLVLFILWLSHFTLFGQNQQMESRTSNFSTLSSSKNIENLNEWKKYNNIESYNHPEFGILSYNAPCSNCIEILDKRTENEKFFLSITNPNEFYQQKSYGAINFNKNGNWLTIDERLKKIDENLFFAENQIDPTGLNTQHKNTFIKTPFGTVQFNNWKLIGFKNNVNSEIAIADWSDYTVGENGIYIKNIFKGIDLELKFSRGSIKSNFVIVKNYFSEFEALVFEDDFNSTSPGYFVFENSSNATRGVGELLYKVNSENTLEIGMALIYPQGLQKEKSQNAEYIIHENKMGIVIPMDWINENLNENNRLIIDPVVTNASTLAQASITCSGYNATCFNGFCPYNLSVPTPANATVTDVQWSFNYRAQGGCWLNEGAVTFLLGTCRSPSQNNFFWYCGLPPFGPGDCTGSNISMFTDVSSCLPPPSCTPQNLNFTMRFHRCWGTGGGCSNSCIGAISPWTMTITGRTLEYTNATPITLSNTTICQGGTITASTAASFGVPPYNYNWSLNSNMTPSNGSGASSTFSFPNHSEVQTQIQVHGFGLTDTRRVHNLAGKYRAGHGTPFDLEDLKDSAGIDLNAITHVKIIDVIGSIGLNATYDSYGNKINEPFSSPYESGGFDLDGVGVINQLVSIQEEQPLEVSIFPNPSNGRIYLHTNTTEPFIINIFSIYGKKLIHQERNMNTIILDLDLPNGIYILHYQQKSALFKSVLILEK